MVREWSSKMIQSKTNLIPQCLRWGLQHSIRRIHLPNSYTQILRQPTTPQSVLVLLPQKQTQINIDLSKSDTLKHSNYHKITPIEDCPPEFLEWVKFFKPKFIPFLFIIVPFLIMQSNGKISVKPILKIEIAPA